MMQASGPGRNGETQKEHPHLSSVRKALQSVHSSGQYYFFAGGGEAGGDVVQTGRSRDPDHEQLLQEMAWGFSDNLQGANAAVIAEVYGRSTNNSTSTSGGGDLIIGTTAYSWQAPNDPRMIFLACHFKYGRVDYVVEQLCTNPVWLQQTLAVFDPRFESGELQVIQSPRISRVYGAVKDNPVTGQKEFYRGR
jgi:hypothetical protein